MAERSTFWRMTIFIVGLASAAVLGNFAGRALTTNSDDLGLYRGVGAVLCVCLFTYLYFKFLGPIGRDRSPMG